jgi:hypothetical protein
MHTPSSSVGGDSPHREQAREIAKTQLRCACILYRSGKQTAATLKFRK